MLKNFRKSEEDNFTSFFYRSLNYFLTKIEHVKIPVIDLEIGQLGLYSEIASNTIIAGKEARIAMKSLEYQPPEDKISLLLHLKEIWHIYRSEADFPPNLDGMCLDISLIKLLMACHRHLGESLAKAERELVRTRKSAKMKKRGAERRKQISIAIYNYGDEIHKNTKFSDVVRIIQHQFEKSKEDKNAPWGKVPANMHTPSRDAIMNWFKEEGIWDLDFEQRGRYWFKCM